MKVIEVLILIIILMYAIWVIRKKISDVKSGKGCGCGCSDCQNFCAKKELNKEKRIQ